MPVSRRKFIDRSFKSICWIAGTNLLSPLQGVNDEALLIESAIKLRFAVFSDGHYGQKGTSFENFHAEMIRWMNDEQASGGLDFAIINGDLFHDDPEVIPGLKVQLAQLKMPWYPTHGNHDLIDERGWELAFGYPYNYVLERKEAVCIFLNTADEKGKYIQADSAWLSTQFQKYEGSRHIFLFMHITPFGWTKAGFNNPEIVSLLSRQYNLRAIFHGHDHEEDGYKEYEGKYYFFDGHSGGNWGLPYRGYRIVEVYKNHRIATYQMNPEQKLKENTFDLS